jgi:hypothetical protein
MVLKEEEANHFLPLPLSLHCNFHLRPNKKNKMKIFKISSNWQPPNHKQKALQTLFKNVAKYLQKLIKNQLTMTLTSARER